jgi:hypothetical protein
MGQGRRDGWTDDGDPMTVLAYSTTVSVRNTCVAIDDVLTRYGAQDVTRIGPAAAPTGIAFSLASEFGIQRFRLPVNTARVQERLKAEYGRGKVERAQTTPEHAERVAWRQLLKWLESHLAAIDGGLFTTAHLFAPFLEVAPGHTVYELLVERKDVLGLPAPRATATT